MRHAAGADSDSNQDARRSPEHACVQVARTAVQMLQIVTDGFESARREQSTREMPFANSSPFFASTLLRACVTFCARPERVHAVHDGPGTASGRRSTSPDGAAAPPARLRVSHLACRTRRTRLSPSAHALAQSTPLSISGLAASTLRGPAMSAPALGLAVRSVPADGASSGSDSRDGSPEVEAVDVSPSAAPRKVYRPPSASLYRCRADDAPARGTAKPPRTARC